MILKLRFSIERTTWCDEWKVFLLFYSLLSLENWRAFKRVQKQGMCLHQSQSVPLSRIRQETLLGLSDFLWCHRSLFDRQLWLRLLFIWNVGTIKLRLERGERLSLINSWGESKGYFLRSRFIQDNLHLQRNRYTVYFLLSVGRSISNCKSKSSNWHAWLKDDC